MIRLSGTKMWMLLGGFDTSHPKAGVGDLYGVALESFGLLPLAFYIPVYVSRSLYVSNAYVSENAIGALPGVTCCIC